MQDLEDSNAFAILKTERVKYVIYHLVDLTPNPYDDWRFFRAGPRPTESKLQTIQAAGFKLIKEFPEALVFEINLFIRLRSVLTLSLPNGLNFFIEKNSNHSSVIFNYIYSLYLPLGV